MTQDKIIRMAREAGYQSVYLADAPVGRSYKFLERFAAIVAANEREACAKVCEQLGALNTATPQKLAAAIRARINDGTA